MYFAINEAPSKNSIVYINRNLPRLQSLHVIWRKMSQKCLPQDNSFSYLFIYLFIHVQKKDNTNMLLNTDIYIHLQ